MSLLFLSLTAMLVVAVIAAAAVVGVIYIFNVGDDTDDVSSQSSTDDITGQPSIDDLTDQPSIDDVTGQPPIDEDQADMPKEKAADPEQPEQELVRCPRIVSGSPMHPPLKYTFHILIKKSLP